MSQARGGSPDARAWRTLQDAASWSDARLPPPRRRRRRGVVGSRRAPRRASSYWRKSARLHARAVSPGVLFVAVWRAGLRAAAEAALEVSAASVLAPRRLARQRQATRQDGRSPCRATVFEPGPPCARAPRSCAADQAHGSPRARARALATASKTWLCVVKPAADARPHYAEFDILEERRLRASARFSAWAQTYAELVRAGTVERLLLALEERLLAVRQSRGSAASVDKLKAVFFALQQRGILSAKHARRIVGVLAACEAGSLRQDDIPGVAASRRRCLRRRALLGAFQHLTAARRRPAFQSAALAAAAAAAAAAASVRVSCPCNALVVHGFAAPGRTPRPTYNDHAETNARAREREARVRRRARGRETAAARHVASANASASDSTLLSVLETFCALVSRGDFGDAGGADAAEWLKDIFFVVQRRGLLALDPLRAARIVDLLHFSDAARLLHATLVRQEREPPAGEASSDALAADAAAKALVASLLATLHGLSTSWPRSVYVLVRRARAWRAGAGTVVDRVRPRIARPRVCAPPQLPPVSLSCVVAACRRRRETVAELAAALRLAIAEQRPDTALHDALKERLLRDAGFSCDNLVALVGEALSVRLLGRAHVVLVAFLLDRPTLVVDGGSSFYFTGRSDAAPLTLAGVATVVLHRNELHAVRATRHQRRLYGDGWLADRQPSRFMDAFTAGMFRCVRPLDGRAIAYTLAPRIPQHARAFSHISQSCCLRRRCGARGPRRNGGGRRAASRPSQVRCMLRALLWREMMVVGGDESKNGQSFVIFLTAEMFRCPSGE